MIPASLTLAFLLVLAPGMVFLFGLVEPLPGLAAALLGALAAVPTVRATDWRGRPDWRVLALAILVAAALTFTSGIGHFVWQADDWTVRDAILSDLVRNPWPVSYALPGGVSLLRAPLGMYLVPALAGKIGGLAAAQAALFAQNAALLALCIYLFARAQAPGRARLVMIGLFVAFSGLDCIGWAKRMIDGKTGLGLPHIEPWPAFFEYTSNVTEVLWTPHHGLAGWALVGGYLVWREGRIGALALAPLWAASVFWSPLAALGAAPFLAFALVCDIVDGKWRAIDFAAAAAAGLAALPSVIYLARDSAGVEKGFLDFSNPAIVRAYLAMMALEVLPYLAIAWQGRDARDRRATIELGLTAACLFLIPFYNLGFADDFAMRVSIPALTLLCVRAVPALAAVGREPASRRAIMLGIVGLGAVTPAIEIGRNLAMPASPLSACNVVESLKDGPFANSPLDYYVASAASFDAIPGLFTQATGAPLGSTIRRCWPGRRFVYGPAVPTK